MDSNKSFDVKQSSFVPLVIQQVRAAAFGSFERLQPAPFFYILVMSGQQNFRHLPSLPNLRACVLRVFQQPFPVALINEALFIRQNTGHKPAYRVSYNHCGYLSPCQDIVAN
jgi:hypothetical protein